MPKYGDLVRQLVEGLHEGNDLGLAHRAIAGSQCGFARIYPAKTGRAALERASKSRRPLT
jgi:hypothetical protein